MAESPPAHDPATRYRALERAYTEDRWPDVLRDGETLIAALKDQQDCNSEALCSRAQLLLGHAYLYGLRTPASARAYYQAVLAGPADAELHRLAAAALQYCQPVSPGAGPDPGQPQPGAAQRQPTASEPPANQPAASGQLDPFLERVAEAAKRPTTAAARPPLATPWLVDNSSQGVAAASETSGAKPAPSLAASLELGGLGTQPQPLAMGKELAGELELAAEMEVELVLEPELLEVIQADPSLVEELEIIASQPQRSGANPATRPSDQDANLDDPELLAGLLRVVVGAP